MTETTGPAGEHRRLVTTVLVASDLDASAALYSRAFGLDLHTSDHAGPDRFTSGRHVAATWSDGDLVHFAIYETADGRPPTRGAQVAFRVTDLDDAHRRAVAEGAEVLHGPRSQPWGRSARYADPDGNVVELTQPV